MKCSVSGCDSPASVDTPSILCGEHLLKWVEYTIQHPIDFTQRVRPDKPQGKTEFIIEPRTDKTVYRIIFDRYWRWNDPKMKELGDKILHLLEDFDAGKH